MLSLPLFLPLFILALVQIDENARRRRERGAERARKHRAKRKAAAAEKEERAKRQRLEDYEELKVSFMYFFVDITFVPDLLSLSLFPALF